MARGKRTSKVELLTKKIGEVNKKIEDKKLQLLHLKSKKRN